MTLALLGPLVVLALVDSTSFGTLLIPIWLMLAPGRLKAGRILVFLATVAAGPVYRLLGRKDLGVTALPPLDTPLTSGDLGWHYHTGGHTATPADWAAFLEFLAKYF